MSRVGRLDRAQLQVGEQDYRRRDCQPQRELADRLGRAQLGEQHQHGPLRARVNDVADERPRKVLAQRERIHLLRDTTGRAIGQARRGSDAADRGLLGWSGCVSVNSHNVILVLISTTKAAPRVSANGITPHVLHRTAGRPR